MLRKRLMTRGFNARSAFVSVCLLSGMAVGAFWLPRLFRPVKTSTLIGVALAADTDPQKQVPITDAAIQVSNGRRIFSSKSNATGYFEVDIPTDGTKQNLKLSIQHPEYLPVADLPVEMEKITVLRLTPTRRPVAGVKAGPTLSITNLKIRYTTKEENMVNIGSLVRSVPVPNKGNVRCGNNPVCSPDRKWKASITTVSFDAGERNQFINIRASCVAGPCAFTRLESSNIAHPVRRIQLSIRNWSDPATYLLEAEVRQTSISDMVRRSFPAILGATMDFTLPASAEGPSIEADLNGTSIVFPLGPNLLLSWAVCTAENASGATRLFRCELKPGFEFR